MSFLDRIPVVDKCCGCVTDLKTATAIIAVLGIVTSPTISWAMVRHAYIIRVSCMVTTNATRPDVVDINLHNALSFGFGANSGLGPSCISQHMNASESEADNEKTKYIKFVRYSGWLVLLADVIFLASSVNLLIKMFLRPDKQASLIFIIAGLISILLTFTYGILYVSACMYVGGGFPIFEFFFAMVDLIMCILWLYFLSVVNSYYQLTPPGVSISEQLFKILTNAFITLYGYATNITTKCFGYKILLVIQVFLIFSVDLLFNRGICLQTKSTTTLDES